MPTKVQIILELVDKASKEAKTAQKNFKDFGKGLLAVTAGVAAFGIAVKKAFELGREGAEIRQTAQSFDFLLEKVGAAPDLLSQLQDASRGTVSDMQLMSSTATLLAGTYGELGTAMAGATPELLEIAKAAQKLNPALGDTTFLYESLARGIKRSSPLILDNLGLVVKVGEANKKYAKQLGKSTDALTAQEKQMALLNEVLEAGDVLIQQVGGSTESLTDDYDRLTTASKNWFDSVKAGISEGLNPFITALTTELRQAQLVREELNKGAITVDFLTGKYRDASGELLTHADVVRRVSHEQEVLARNARLAAEYVDELGDEAGELAAITPINILADIDTNIESDMDNVLKKIKFLEGGSQDIANKWKLVKAGIEDATIPIGLAEEAIIAFKMEMLAAKVVAREMTLAGAIEEARKLGLTYGEAKAKLQAVANKMDALDGKEIDFFVNIITKGSMPKPTKPEPTGVSQEEAGGEVEGSFQHGANFVVPAGFPSDSFRIGVTSGERVIVQTKGQQSEMDRIDELALMLDSLPRKMASELALELAKAGIAG
jgi:hypothetical protein